MLSEAYRKSFSEVLDILKHTKKEDVKKISPKFIKYIEENALENYVPNLDHSQSIEKMNLELRTKAILAFIYRKYWRTNTEFKNEQYKDDFAEKTVIYSEQIIADKKQEVISIENEKTEELMPYDESIFKRIIERIKSFFKKK